MTDSECARRIMESVPRAMRMIKTEMRASAGAGLTVPQFRALARLARLGPEHTTNREAAAWMGVADPTMSRMVDALVTKGYVTRNQGGADRRRYQLVLTASGRKKHEKMRAAVHEKFSLRVAKLSPERKQTLAEGLDVLRELFP